MAQIDYRGNLSAAKFPLVSQYQGRTVIVARQDSTFTPQVASKEDQDKDRGIPQLYYCHNVMPTGEGYSSVGYDLRVTPELVTTEFEQIYKLAGPDGSTVYFCHHTLSGRNWVLDPRTGITWYEIDTVGAGVECTVAQVQGAWFVNFSTIDTYKYSFSTTGLTLVTLTGLNATEVIGITSSNGYLIAYTKLGVFWSSTVDVTDFTPSLITGAGGGSIEQAKGAINYCLPQTLGFIVYCEGNVVAAAYSGNSRYPFNFREIVGSGGLDAANTSDTSPQVGLVTADAANGAHYAFTTAGLQQISIQQAKAIYPGITDFIAGLVFEDFNESTLTFSVESLTSRLQRKIAFVADRYLVISYGKTALTHAIVVDTAQDRIGKLKLTHTCCFEYRETQLDAESTDARSSIGFMQADGTIYTANLAFNPVATTSNGVALFGKFQYYRNQLLTLHEVGFENVPANKTFACYDLLALDGKNTTVRAGTPKDTDGNLRTYAFRCTAKNHSILAIGNFYLNSILLTFTNAGER